MYKEIKKLHTLLTDARIPHTFEKMPALFGGGYQIRVYADEAMTRELDDAVCHRFSHGFAQGLLETYHLSDCDGFETAEDVFMGWQEMYNKIKEKA